MNDAAITALADKLEAQLRALRQERQRLEGLERRLMHEPTRGSWQGMARNAFDREFELLRNGVRGSLRSLEDAISCTAQARESVLHRVG